MRNEAYCRSMAGIPSLMKRRTPADTASTAASMRGSMPGLSALPQLAVAVKSGDEKALRDAKETFEGSNGRITNSYFSAHTDACALLVERPSRAGELSDGSKQIQVLLLWMDRRDIAMQHLPFIAAYWRTIGLARRIEHESSDVLTRRTRNLCLDMLFDVAVSLLGVVDSVASRDGSGVDALRETATVAAVNLDSIERFAERGAIHRTFRHYLSGLPAGALLLAAPLFAVEQLLPITESAQHLIALCITGGGIGAMTSVMVRVTRGQQLSVDVHQGGVVTFLAGMFRPMVGAIFSVALYTLLEGGLLPIVVEERAAQFYGGLSFLAGFSERWAQDMIVRSTPIAPSPATAAGHPSSDERTHISPGRESSPWRP